MHARVTCDPVLRVSHVATDARLGGVLALNEDCARRAAWVDEMIRRTSHNGQFPPQPVPDTVTKLRDCKILLTGFTGDVGGALARHMALRCPGNRLYCLIRGSRSLQKSPQQRLEDKIASLSMQKHAHQFVVVPADYSKPRLGISDKDWDMLAREMDVVAHLGCHVSLVQSWDRAKRGILAPSNVMIELARTVRVKPLIMPGSQAERLAGLYAGHTGVHRGYALAKNAEIKTLDYLYAQTSHPTRVMYIGYMYSPRYCIFSEADAWESVMWVTLKTGKFPDWDMLFDYADLEDAAGKFVDQVDFSEGAPRVLGCYAKEVRHWSSFYPIMKRICPNLKKVSGKEWATMLRNEFIDKPGAEEKYGCFKFLAKLMDDGSGVMPPQQNVLAFPKPPHNMEIRTPSDAELERMFRWMAQRPSFHYMGLPQRDTTRYFERVEDPFPLKGGAVDAAIKLAAKL